jgi:hypothetical protein
MTGFWYTREESPLRQTIWYSAIGWGGMIGALMAAGIQVRVSLRTAGTDRAERSHIDLLYCLTKSGSQRRPRPSMEAHLLHLGKWSTSSLLLLLVSNHPFHLLEQGAITIAWAFVLYFFMVSRPSFQSNTLVTCSDRLIYYLGRWVSRTLFRYVTPSA